MRALSSSTRALRHALGAGTEALLVAAIVAALLVALAPIYRPADWFAGNAGAAAGANTITIVSGGARLAVGATDEVTTFSTLARDYYLVYVRATCSVDGRNVYEAWRNIKTGTWDTDGYASFAIDTGAWGGAPADCRADLLNAVWKGGRQVYRQLATTGF